MQRWPGFSAAITSDSGTPWKQGAVSSGSIRWQTAALNACSCVCLAQLPPPPQQWHPHQCFPLKALLPQHSIGFVPSPCHPHQCVMFATPCCRVRRASCRPSGSWDPLMASAASARCGCIVGEPSAAGLSRCKMCVSMSVCVDVEATWSTQACKHVCEGGRGRRGWRGGGEHWRSM